jgi:hypothetical protein
VYQFVTPHLQQHLDNNTNKRNNKTSNSSGKTKTTSTTTTLPPSSRRHNSKQSADEATCSTATTREPFGLAKAQADNDDDWIDAWYHALWKTTLNNVDRTNVMDAVEQAAQAVLQNYGLVAAVDADAP